MEASNIDSDMGRRKKYKEEEEEEPWKRDFILSRWSQTRQSLVMMKKKNGYKKDHKHNFSRY